MRSPCETFRARLELVLSAQPELHEMRALSWHEHLLVCSACRSLLAAEEALEVLLASLPDPRLPDDLARRVIARLQSLREAEDVALDDLLSRADDAVAPADLAANVLAGLAARRSVSKRSLDELLDLDEVRVPNRLAARVLDRLEEERRATHVRSRFRVLRSPAALPAAAGLAALALGWLGWTVFTWDGSAGAVDEEVALLEPSAELLEALDVLEEWDVLMDDDVDLLLATMEPADEALLDYDETSDEEGGG